MVKYFIQKAIKHPGTLRKTAGVKKGQKIPKKKLEELAKRKGKTGKRSKLALTLATLRKKS